ncbi:histidine kinase [Shouchella sp. 1P09AA]|uniref:sensor histidine kinase n=1 Tax=unclassified Shouchella TaxID=2893065 RepID=UPI0039A02DDD
MKIKKLKDEIQRSFFMYAIGVLIFIFIVYGLSLAVSFQNSIVDPSNRSHEELIDQLDTGFTSYYQGVAELVENDTIHAFLQTGDYSREVYEKLYDFRNNEDLYAEFVLLDKNETLVATSFYDGMEDEVRRSIVLNNLIQKSNEQGMFGQRLNQQIRNQNDHVSYVIASPVIENDEINGYALFFLEQLSFANRPYTYVIDSNENVVFTNQDFGVTSLGKLNMPLNGKWVRHEGEDFYLKETVLTQLGLKIITLTPITIYWFLLFYGIASILISSFVILLMVWFVTPKIITSSLQPFDRLVAFMQAKKDQPFFQADHQYEEVQTIYEEYKSRVSEVERLMVENETILEKKRISEMKHLEAKFNPHFLFNVLEMIKYEIHTDPESASDMVVKTAKLMRYNANFGQTIVTLKEDITYLEDYFSLQKMRYGKRLDYQIDVNEELLTDARIPKLLLQPLIENAVKHNINQVSKLFIQLTVRRKGNKLFITLFDNGLGISAHELNEIRAIYSGENEAQEQTGLHTVHQLITLLYGHSYGLHMESTLEKGTTVSITLPFKERGIC